MVTVIMEQVYCGIVLVLGELIKCIVNTPRLGGDSAFVTL